MKGDAHILERTPCPALLLLVVRAPRFGHTCLFQGLRASESSSDTCSCWVACQDPNKRKSRYMYRCHTAIAWPPHSYCITPYSRQFCAIHKNRDMIWLYGSWSCYRDSPPCGPGQQHRSDMMTLTRLAPTAVVKTSGSLLCRLPDPSTTLRVASLLEQGPPSQHRSWRHDMCEPISELGRPP